MKFFHLSDLHIGKYLNGYNLKENQEAVLEQIVEYARKAAPDAVLICGDIYDKSVPSGEAYGIFDHFLESLGAACPAVPIFIIAGNHDSPQRLSYASGFLRRHGIYLSTMPPSSPGEFLTKVTVQDSFGPVNFYLLPFLKPGYVRGLFQEGENPDYEGAVRRVLERENINWEERNVLLSHQYYRYGSQSPQTCDSETMSLAVGGLDEIDAALVEAFDYVALGHLHGPQKVGRDHIRYCGSPYKYSVSEENQHKAVTLVTLSQKGRPASYEFLPLQGIQDVRRVKGSLEEVLGKAGQGNSKDFVSITVTDDLEGFFMRERLEQAYEYLLEIKVDNARTRAKLQDRGQALTVLSPMEAFHRFYEEMRQVPMSQEEERVMKELFRELKEDGR